MAITARMAKALAEWRTAKYFHREARQAFNTAVDLYRDVSVEEWANVRGPEVTLLRDAVKAANRALDVAGERIRVAELYDRQERIHGVKQEVA